MSVDVRLENGAWPTFRILIADVFGHDGSGPWTDIGHLGNGGTVYLEECTRQALPAIGEATLTQEFGVIDGVEVTPLDLRDYHIRIQAARVPTNQTQTPQWRTIWIGRCEWMNDVNAPGSDVPTGTRTFHCVDLLRTYLAAYPMDRHANYAVTGALSYGHPGYNTDKTEQVATADQITNLKAMGNKDATDSSYTGPNSTAIANFAIVDSAAGVTTRAWTDAEIVENAMLLRRSAGDPIFVMDVATDGGVNTVLDGLTSVPVSETDMAWDVVTRVLSRSRGKGMAFLDWDDDVLTPDGALSVFLAVRPQMYAPYQYDYPLGTTNTIVGAAGTAIYWTRVDLENDHRVEDGDFAIRETSDSAVDELVTEGEPIEVVVTVSGGDNTLAERWSTELETAWAAAGEAQSEAKYKPVLQAFGLVRTAGINFANGDGGSPSRADYWTDEDGFVTYAHTCVTPPQYVEVMDDLPFYEGYDYSVDPQVPAASAYPDGSPRRRKPFVLVKTTTNRFLLPKEYIDGGCSINVDRDTIWCEWSGDEDIGFRSIRGDWPGVSTRTITEASLTFTIGLRMPQRPRFVTSISVGTVRRRRVIRVPNRHLWIAHPGAIWDLDRATENADGCQAKKAGGTMGSIPGKTLRDDRAALARIHHQAWQWYRSDFDRRAVTYSIRDCGLLPSWTDMSGTNRSYAYIGQVIWELTAAGETYTIDTPVTQVAYNNRNGVTTWRTDWVEFDYGSA